MFRLISLLLIGLGGFWVLQNRFKVINVVLGNRVIRKFFVSSLMSLPFVKDQMMKTVFSSNNNTNQFQ